MKFFDLGNKNKINSEPKKQIKVGKKPFNKKSATSSLVPPPPLFEKRVNKIESNPVSPNFIIYHLAAKNNSILKKSITEHNIFEKI